MGQLGEYREGARNLGDVLSTVQDEHQRAQKALAQRQARLRDRLSAVEDSYFDRVIGKDRYIQRRDEYLAGLREIDRSLVPVVETHTVDFAAEVEGITWDSLEADTWRRFLDVLG